MSNSRSNYNTTGNCSDDLLQECRFESDSRKSKLSSDDNKSFQVFRNNTTAIEVIVKELPTKNKQKHSNKSNYETMKLEDENKTLKKQLVQTELYLHNLKADFKTIVYQMKTQLDMTSKREIENQTELVNLKLENEKLKTSVEMKTSAITKLKKEMSLMKKQLKHIIRGISTAPAVPTILTSNDKEYEDFESDLKKGMVLLSAKDLLDATDFTMNSTVSKDITGIGQGDNKT